MWRAISIGVLVCVAAAAQAVQFDWIKRSLFFAYTPSQFYFEHDRPVFASRNSIAQDLQLLRRYSDGLILYSTDKSTDDILTISHELNFNVVILGIWTITDKNEINRTIELAHRYPKLVRAIAVGNEGLFWKRYTKAELAQTMQAIRTALPDIALTTTEPFSSYLGTPTTLDCSNQDFLLPTIHPVFESWFSPSAMSQSVDFVDSIVTRLSKLCRKQVLVKETGVPSGPAYAFYSEQQQRMFWQQLLVKVNAKPDVSVALFEAFDAPWKVTEMKKQSGKYDVRERYWGWFTHERKPKAVVDLLRVQH